MVAVAGAVATAHGLYGVAVASGLPVGIAALYPVLADGLALVAYAATTQLSSGGVGYAWSVVVTTAGASAWAQALHGPQGVSAVPALAQAAVRGWPALSIAVTAHLVFLLRRGAVPVSQLGPTAVPEGVPLASGGTVPPEAIPVSPPVPPEPVVPAVVPAPQSQVSRVPRPIKTDNRSGARHDCDCGCGRDYSRSAYYRHLKNGGNTQGRLSVVG